MMLSVKDLLRQLIRLPSVNPAFEAGDSSICGESKLTHFLQNFFENLEIPSVRQQVHPGRDNLIVVFRTSGTPKSASPMLWEVHQDTVGVQGMQIAPFAGLESEGRIWGRGACDVKGSMAAMLTALARVRDSAVEMARPIILAMTINEERGFTGVKALSRLWSDDQGALADMSRSLQGPLSFVELLQLRPSQAIVAEPTLFDVVVAHKGGVAWKCHAHGKAAHSSRPDRGINAISAMSEVVRAVEQFDREVLRQRKPHPLCGPPSACVTTMRGGTGANTVPDHAVIDIDCRLLPDDQPETARQELIDYVERATTDTDAKISHELPENQCIGLRDHDNHDWARQIASVADAVCHNGASPNADGRKSQLIGVPFGTDAWVLSQVGIPTVVFGPGSIEQAHTDDEWIAIEQLELATEIFYRLAISA